MFHSLFRVTAASVLVLALLLSAVPSQALPLDSGSRSVTADASWLDAALSWLPNLLSGGDEDQEGGHAIPMTGSCLDPYGRPVSPCPDNQ